jgi:hypothetical protein
VVEVAVKDEFALNIVSGGSGGEFATNNISITHSSYYGNSATQLVDGHIMKFG